MGAGGGVVHDSSAGVILPISLHAKSNAVDWVAVADLVWVGMTVPDACKKLGHDWAEADRQLDTEKRRYLVDVSMLANVKEDYLCQQQY